MGIPVSGKNIFPSNIQGLPTWYTIRLSKDGYLGRVEEKHIVVAMNPNTFQRDHDSVIPGGVLFYPDDFKQPVTRQDIIAYPMPVKKLVKESEVAPTLRDYISNMVYVGILSQMIGIDLDKIYQALDFHFKGKKKAIEFEFHHYQSCCGLGARESGQNRSLFCCAHEWDRRLRDDGWQYSRGAWVRFMAGFSLSPGIRSRRPPAWQKPCTNILPMFRKDPETGKDTFAVVQAEDELAAIGMAVGAGWSGLRSMTSTSGPGISLMSEYLGLAYFAELPVVVWDVQRVGPSTGLPTRTSPGGPDPGLLSRATVIRISSSCCQARLTSALNLAGKRLIWLNGCRRRLWC